MARISNKASPDQVRRLLKNANPARAVNVRVMAVLQDEEELLMEAAFEDARADAEWPQSVIDSIADHADGQGPGFWRYAIRVYNSEDRVTTATWCRMRVVKSKGGADGEDDEGLDGSVASYVQQLQSSLEESHKTNIALTRTVVDTLKAQSEHFKMIFEHQNVIEKDRAELQKENLDHTARQIIEAAQAATAKGDADPFSTMMEQLGPTLIEKLVDKFSPQVLKFLGIDVQAELDEMKKKLEAGDDEKPKQLPSGDGEPTPEAST